jgi:hypothetical protein
MKNKQILLNENQYRLLFESDDFTENLVKLKKLIESGQKENIEIAFQLGGGMESYIPNFKLDEYLKTEYQSLIDFINIGRDKVQGENIFEQVSYIFTLSILRLYNLGLTSLSVDLKKLANLKALYIGKNKFDNFPLIVCDIIGLETLNVVDNNFKKIPNEISKLINLKDLNLADNDWISIQEVKSIKKMIPKCIIKYTLDLPDSEHKAYRQL